MNEREQKQQPLEYAGPTRRGFPGGWRGWALALAIMVGVGRGAQAGVLVKNAEALELLGKVNCLIVDKTGTLTEGKPQLVTIWTGDTRNETHVLTVAASLENHSEHPIAQAMVRAAQSRHCALQPVGEFASHTGRGVMGRIDGKLIRIGQEEWLREQQVAVAEDWQSRAAQLRQAGQTVVFVAENDRPIAILGVADPIKETTRGALAELQTLGVKVVMATGDNAATAHGVADTLGIAEVHAGCQPSAKYELVLTLKRSGARVAMAGDGVNDGPALAAADVGIAMGTGTDVAMASAGLTLVKGDLRGIAKAIHLSRATMRNIRQNLFFAFVYNALGVPIAAGILHPFFGILLSPMIAGAAMSFSSVSVITNALRLRRVRL